MGELSRADIRRAKDATMIQGHARSRSRRWRHIVRLSSATLESNRRHAVNTLPLMILRVKVSSPQNIGAVPHGTRRMVPLNGGDFDGPRLRGTVLPHGSADWLLLRADGVLELDLRVTLLTHDGALISMKSFGLRHGPPEVIAALARGEAVDPALYYFRTTPRFETAHPTYAFLNRIIAVATGDRRGDGPIYAIHEVL
jgi:hypothetical protein